MKYTSEEIQLAYEEASPKIKEILDDNWVAEVAAKIGQEVNLRIDKVDILIQIIGLTLLNIISISEFSKILEKELFLNKNNALALTKKIDILIFQKVRRIITGEEEEEKKDVSLEIEKKENQEKINELINDINDKGDNNLSFKDKFNKVTIKKVEDRIVDPYRESID